MISIALGTAGCLTVITGVMALGLMRKWQAETVFTEQRPAWLIFLTWGYLTLSVLAWIYFAGQARPAALLAAGIMTIFSLKFIFIFLSYPHFIHIGRALWADQRALTVVMLSTISVGILMIYMTRWV